MPVDRDSVDHVARLARLRLTEQERERMRLELGNILDHAIRIQELELDGIPPTTHGLGLSNVLRDDEVKPSLDQADALANAPEVEDGRFKVPRIVEETP